MVLEDDINQLLTAHEALAACVLADAAELPENLLARQVSEELMSLRNLKERQVKLEQDYYLLDSQRQRTEEQLFEKEQDLHYFAVLGSQIQWTADGDGKLLYVDPRWLSLIGASLDQLIGDKWLQLVHSDDLDNTRLAWADGLNTGQPLDIEYRIRNSCGSYVWVRSRAVPRHGADKSILKWYGFIENIEKRKETELAIRQSEKLAVLGRLANSIAHEVNNPLEAVTNLLFLSQMTDDLPALKGYLAVADRELRRVAICRKSSSSFSQAIVRSHSSHMRGVDCRRDGTHIGAEFRKLPWRWRSECERAGPFNVLRVTSGRRCQIW